MSVRNGEVVKILCITLSLAGIGAHAYLKASLNGDFLFTVGHTSGESIPFDSELLKIIGPPEPLDLNACKSLSLRGVVRRAARRKATDVFRLFWLLCSIDGRK